MNSSFIPSSWHQLKKAIKIGSIKKSLGSHSDSIKSKQFFLVFSRSNNDWFFFHDWSKKKVSENVQMLLSHKTTFLLALGLFVFLSSFFC